jgi:nucleoside-diphosphate-sugar epimerase
MNVLVAGGTGFVGSGVIRALLRNGHKAIVPVRPGSEHKVGLSENISLIETDFRRSDLSLSVKPDALVNCIGIIRQFPSKGVTFKKIQYDIVRYLIELAKTNDIKRFVQVSALGTSPGARTEYFKTKFMAEELLTASYITTTIFRPSIVFGTGDDFINMVAKYLRRFSAMPVVGNGKYRLQPVHIDDLSNVIVKSIDDQFTYNNAFDIGGPDILTFNDLVDVIAGALGKKGIKLHQPAFFIRIMATILDRFSWFPITREQITMLYMENYTRDTRIFDRYGIERTKLADGIKGYL